MLFRKNICGSGVSKMVKDQELFLDDVDFLEQLIFKVLFSSSLDKALGFRVLETCSKSLASLRSVAFLCLCDFSNLQIIQKYLPVWHHVKLAKLIRYLPLDFHVNSCLCNTFQEVVPLQYLVFCRHCLRSEPFSFFVPFLIHQKIIFYQCKELVYCFRTVAGMLPI